MMLPQQVAPDTTQTTAFDSIWANPEVPVETLNALDQLMLSLDQLMLSQDKLFVVLAVVLISWFGLVFFVFRTDRKLDRLERTLEERIGPKE